MQEDFFDEDNVMLKYGGNMPLRWSDFDTLGLKSKMKMISHETVVNYII